MKQSIIHVTLLVDNYDDAIRFYVNKLRFTLIEDTPLPDVNRWVLIRPPGAAGCCLLLAKAADQQQAAYIGNQCGGRVFLFLETDDLYRNYHQMLADKVVFVHTPVVESYGINAVFKDL